jgi:hypothetical protein
MDAQGDVAGRLRPMATRVVDTTGDPTTARERVLALARQVLESGTSI